MFTIKRKIAKINEEMKKWKKLNFDLVEISHLLGISVGFDNLFNVILGSHDDRDTLMDIVRCNAHDTFLSSGGNTSSLFHDEGHRGSLVQQSKLSVDILGISRVSKNSSVQQGAVDISNHGSNISAGEGCSRFSGSVLPSGDNLLEGFVPHVCVGLVEGHDGGGLRDLHVGVTQDKFTKVLIKSESVRTSTKSQDKESGRRI